MQRLYKETMQTIKRLDIQTRKEYKAIMKDYNLLSIESLRYLTGIGDFREIIKLAKK